MVGTVERTKNDTLKIFNFFIQEYEEYIEIEPDVFQEIDGQQKLAFLRGDNGNVDGLIWASLPIITFKRAPLWELPFVSAGILAMTAIMVSCMLLSQLFSLIKKLAKKESSPQPKTAVAANRLGLVVATLNIIFLLSVVLSIDEDFIFAGVPPAWPFYIPWVVYLVSLLMPWYSYCSWKEGFWRCRGRIFYLTFTITMQLWFGMLWYWMVVPHFW